MHAAETAGRIGRPPGVVTGDQVESDDSSVGPGRAGGGGEEPRLLLFVDPRSQVAEGVRNARTFAPTAGSSALAAARCAVA
jgi:hypothetical protein